MEAKIKERKEIAKGTLLVAFDLLGQEVDFRPGKYFFVTLPNPTFTDSDDRGPTHHFSIVNSPNQKGIIAMATRIRDSAFKKSLQEMPIGSSVEIDRIQGGFLLPRDFSRPVVFIAGGIGITPYMSMIRYVTENNLRYNITLIYSNRDQESTAFFDELNKMTENFPNIKVIFTMTQDENWTGEKRRIDEEFIKTHIQGDLNSYGYMVSGSPRMVEEMLRILQNTGIKEENIKQEMFSGY